MPSRWALADRVSSASTSRAIAARSRRRAASIPRRARARARLASARRVRSGSSSAAEHEGDGVGHAILDDAPGPDQVQVAGQELAAARLVIGPGRAGQAELEPADLVGADAGPPVEPERPPQCGPGPQGAGKTRPRRRTTTTSPGATSTQPVARHARASPSDHQGDECRASWPCSVRGDSAARRRSAGQGTVTVAAPGRGGQQLFGRPLGQEAEQGAGRREDDGRPVVEDARGRSPGSGRTRRTSGRGRGPRCAAGWPRPRPGRGSARPRRRPAPGSRRARARPGW